MCFTLHCKQLFKRESKETDEDLEDREIVFSLFMIYLTISKVKRVLGKQLAFRLTIN